MARTEIIDTDAANICDHGFCGFRDPKNEGHQRKTDWLKKRFAEGMRFKVLQVDGADAGMIEYIPGEHTWRPVEAAGHMVIHCIMIDKRKYKGKGYGSLLVEECVRDAKRARMHGVAVVASSGPWMAGGDVFRRCGFECVDTAPPSFELLAKKSREGPSPRFRKGWDRTLRKHGSGLTIIKSDQCPCIAKSMDGILQACEALGVRPKVVELKSGSQSREAPSAYGVFNIIYDGKVVADHPISGTRFRNIMRRILK
ncbi:MAG: GNAT family N-acetyltransferase [Phycisphaerae bacterium]|nr:GNAT family N-acetyltransferase [Phycisphaerae bacterium]